MITWPPPPPTLSAAPKKATAATPPPKAHGHAAPAANPRTTLAVMAVGALVLWGLGSVAPAAFMSHFTVFVLAIFVGYQVIWNVKPALHTPLMSVTNAISGIIVIGALLQISTKGFTITLLAAAAILLATINVAGGFLVTQRMLRMFQK